MRPIVHLLLPASLLTACGGGEPLSLVTFNAGLAVGFVPAATVRAPGIATALGGMEADAVCVQEVWLPEHVADLEGEAATSFEATFFPDARQEVLPDPACTETDLDPLITCMTDNCADVCVDDQSGCLFSNCALPFLGLEKACMGCVQANVGEDPDDVKETCTTENTQFAYGGSFGTGILSRHPIASVEEHVFESTTNRRSVLHAVLDTPGKDLDLYCTHLTAVFAVIPYPREEGSWQEEQYAQIEEMLGFIDETAATETVVLMGDMNTGPEVGDSDAEVPDNWDLFAASRFAAPYVQAEGPCTFCPDNPLQSADTDENGVVIDHVLIDGFEGETTATRILDETFESESCGNPITAAHSDHYGVRVTAGR